MSEQIPNLSGLKAIKVEAPAHERLLDRVAQRRRRRRVGTGAAAVLLACVAIAAGMIGTSDDGPLAPEVVEAAARVTLPGETVATELSAGRLWVLTCEARCAKADAQAELVEIDSSSAEIERMIAVDGAGGLAVGAGSVWVANFSKSSVERIDPLSGDVEATIPLSLPEPVAGSDDRLLPVEVEFGGGALWVVGGRGYLVRIDPASNAIKASYEIPVSSGELVVGEGRVWVAAGIEGVIEVIEASGAVASTPVEGPGGRRFSVSGLSQVDGELWATGLWADPITESGDHGAYVITSQSALVEVDAGGAESRPVPLPGEGLSVFAGSSRTLLLTRKPRARMVYGYSPGGGQIAPAAQLRPGGALLEARDGELWVGVSGSVVELYELNRTNLD